ncbi:uncharacterized protein YpuA (DUF1002 family) [Bacillus pakistanensis]|uniref:Uncharacterized protein YpuA (DUF1002 family) n=1 Tax=Rossellomorea pakistanensis TaxID=992288 RepID=A0ABS2NJT9_9BACI|nr:DUF1002 domain-containing protein [Bacillus pakistanensis]MBM7588085.1 uncharacterized protein YpuA (DUF1002 family) [Bacillus pakistanensis]
MLKRFNKILLMIALLVGVSANQAFAADNDKTDEGINEKFGLPIVVYGESLSDSQKQEVKEALGVTDSSQVEEITATGEDLVKYIEGEDRNARMFSSAKITRKEKGEGLVIERATPGNITQVTDEMYANALLTAGVEDAVVEVASPIKVSGHSALVGIYKAYEVSGEKLDTVRMEVANDELNLATKLADKEGMNQEKVSELLTEIKKEIAEQNPATKEEVEQIVEEKLKDLKIELSPEDRQLLIDLFNKMKDLDINFDNVKKQLEDITSTLQDKLDSVSEDSKGFIQSILDFFKDLFESIANLFK